MEDMNSTQSNNAQKTNTGLIIVIVIAALAIVLGAFAMFRNDDATNVSDTDMNSNSVMMDENADMNDDMVDENATDTNTNDEATVNGEAAGGVSVTIPPVVNDEVKTFTVDSSNFAFSPKEIKVKKGDKVKIVLQNKGGMHDLVIDEFNVATDKLQGDTSDSIEFTADKTGEFQYYCSVGKHREMGMWGTLIVE